MKVYLVWEETDGAGESIKAIFTDYQKAIDLYNKLVAKEKYYIVHWLQEWNTETQKSKVTECSGEL